MVDGDARHTEALRQSGSGSTVVPECHAAVVARRFSCASRGRTRGSVTGVPIVRDTRNGKTLMLIWIALSAGTAAAAAALYGHYRVLPAWLTGPEVCQLDQGGCAVLFRTPRASLLGVPNALLGVMLYVLLAVGLLLDWPPLWPFLMTLPAVAMSMFLGSSLISRGLQCRICWTGHVANGVLAIEFALRAFA